MKKRFIGRSRQKRTVESHCTAADWLLYDAQVDAVYETTSLVSGENGLSFVHHLMDVIRAGLHSSKSLTLHQSEKTIRLYLTS
ncbi:unnamed protein product [Protopolystoma xenopodis]|uniref:Uncharacterized protein n=1 Tax=Protopolystoma xenopodis TaxID=117903 RepID=A0A3S5B2T5_9PLAT|nr:unnamed protein product [Protopolystoma xenopodis]